jgi:predicted nuclease with TOPRIM domain
MATAMDVMDYCDNLTVELAGWKAKMYDLAKKLDKVPTGSKEKVVNEVNELHMIIEELSDRIELLRKECPTSWKPEKTVIENKIGHLGRKLEDVIDAISPSDVGG